jgi:hypothetical protein
VQTQKQIRQLIYSNNEFGPASCVKVVEMMPDLRELQLSNVTKGGGKIVIDHILASVINDGKML